MKLYDDKFRPVHGYEEGPADAIDAESAEKAATYKRDVLKRFIPIDQRQIDRRLSGDRYYVTRKIDGEYAILFHEGRHTVTVNRSGRVRRGIPCIEEAGKLLKAAGIREAVIPAEIYVESGQQPGRLNDLLAALADERRIGTLRLAVFDLLELNGKPWGKVPYRQKWEKLCDLFAAGKRVGVVDMEVTVSSGEVREVYHRWVEEQGAEGLVVRSDMPVSYKIKPRHTFDAAVVGFSEGTGEERGQVRSLLLALMPSAGRYQVVGRVGSGLVEEVREALFDRLSKRVIGSEYIETDANHVAFRMVLPDTVVEVTVGDLLFETDSGPRMNPLLEVEGGAYRIAGTVEGLKFVAPVFVRVRTDKKADESDVRLEQIERFAARTEVPLPPRRSAEAPQRLAASRLLCREVYAKTLGSKVMVQKYMVWKTNKERSGDYPAYVFYYMNFSPDRKEPLQRDVDVSDSPEQIRALLQRALEKNLKGGWRKVSSLADLWQDKPAARRQKKDGST